MGMMISRHRQEPEPKQAAKDGAEPKKAPSRSRKAATGKTE